MKTVAVEDKASSAVKNRRSRAAEAKYSVNQTAKLIGISPSGVRLLLKNRKLGYYQSGKRRIVGESHLEQYLSLIDRASKATVIY